MVKEGRNDHWYLVKARQKLEQKLGWGSVEEWTSEDFQNLSDAILAATDLSLSVTTLKRLVGRVHYNATPHPTTLNAIARFLGFDNWRVFKQKLSTPPDPVPVVDKSLSAATLPIKAAVHKPKWILPSLFFTLLVVLLLVGWGKQATNVKAFPAEVIAQVQFSTHPVSEGLPNTVVFKYDVRNISGKTFEIQQSWDQRKRFTIDPTHQEVTATYYYPGYYRAKMVVDDQIVKEHDLFINSNGWMAAIEQQPIPQYILPEEWQRSPYLSLEAELAASLHEREEIPVLAYYLVEDFGHLQSSDFRLETRLRHTFRNGKAPCQFFYLTINCTRGFMRIPMSIAGCVGEIDARFSDLVISGAETDLSGLAYQDREWQSMQLSVRNKRVELTINQKTVLNGQFAEDIGEVVGFRFKFQGAGEVDELKIWNESNDLVVNETFEEGM